MKTSKIILSTVFLFLTCIAFLPTAFAEKLPAKKEMKLLFGDYDGAFVISRIGSDQMEFYRKNACQKRLSPCSTFKIANTLCALENNVVQNENTILKWDGTKYPFAAWNKDLSLSHAMAVSAVPHYQAIAQKIGKKRMQDFVDSINYGNKDTSGGITRFWLGSSLKISAVEQVLFLKKMLTGQLPVSARSVAIVKNCMLGRVSTKGTLFGKTGTDANAQRQRILGWYVGFVENKQDTYVFAVNIQNGKEPSGSKAKSIANAVLAKMGLV